MIEIKKPFPTAHVKELWQWVTEFQSQMADDSSPKTLAEITEKHSNTECSYGIWKNGVIAGCVWVEAMGDGQFLGHLVFDKKLLSIREKIVATKEAAKAIFGEGARKIYWQTFSDNKAYIWFMQRVGAKIEANFRKYTKRDGQYQDAVLLGMFAEEVR